MKFYLKIENNEIVCRQTPKNSGFTTLKNSGFTTLGNSGQGIVSGEHLVPGKTV